MSIHIVMSSYFRGLTTACLVLLFTIGCSNKNVNEGSTTITDLTLTVSPTTIQANSTAIVEATVTDGTTGLQDQIVNFSVSPVGSGFFTPATDTTDVNGVAAAIFTASISGPANISANVEGTSVTGVRTVNITNASQNGSGNVTLSVTPSLLLANGMDSSTVTITVRDGQGILAPNGTVVKLTAGEKFVDIDSNGYWTQNVDSLVYDANPNGQWDAIGIIPTTAIVAGGAGVATVTYVSGNSALTVYLKATVDDNGIKGDGEVQLQLSPDASISTIYLNSDSMHLSVKETGGIETGNIHATCYDSKGNRVPQGIPVNFIITDGPGGGEHLENVGNGPYLTQTNAQGIATVTLHSGTISGTVRIRAYADTILSNATQVLISAGPPAYIVVGVGSVADCNVPYWNVVGAKVPIIAVVSDIYLNPVNDSEVVYFSTDEGSMKSHESRTREHEGIATTVWISGTNVPTADGIVVISAETAGGTVSNSSSFINSYVADLIYSNNIPNQIAADDDARANVTVHTRDLNGNFVEDGTQIEADATFISVSGGSLFDGCVGSSFRTELVSSSLSRDYSTPGGEDDSVGYYDTVSFWAPNGGSVDYPVALITGPAYKANCILDAPETAYPNENLEISLIIVDRFNNPLGDHTLILTATQGTVSGGTQETNEYGEASGFKWTAPDSATTATISIQDTDPRGNITFSQGIKISP